MIIEIIGPTGAGKSTIARLLAGRLGGPGHAEMASDLALDRPGLRHVTNAQLVNLVQDACGLPFLARALPRHAEVLRLSAGMLSTYAPSRFDRVMNTRSVMRRLGMYEFARAKAGGRYVFLDEGPLLIAYHLFVYSTADLSVAPLERFARTAPLPDCVIYLRSPVAVLAERALSRPDRRRQLTGLSRQDAEAWLDRAVVVFDRLAATEPIARRTLVVENASADPKALHGLVDDLAADLRKWPSPAPHSDHDHDRQVAFG